LVTPLSLLSGTFYSIQRLPDFFQTLSLYNPFFYLIDGLRFGLTGYHDGDLMTGAFVVLGINILLSFLVYRIFKVGYKLKP
ncbi:MAG: ABC transporter permease, partial [Alphaproteobacteria bacterium]